MRVQTPKVGTTSHRRHQRKSYGGSHARLSAPALIKLYGVKAQEAAAQYVAGTLHGRANAKRALTDTLLRFATAPSTVAFRRSCRLQLSRAPHRRRWIPSAGFLRRYVVFQFPEQSILVALWIVHTWLLEAFDYTPYLHVHSAEKRSGRTRLLDVIQLLARRAWRAVSPISEGGSNLEATEPAAIVLAKMIVQFNSGDGRCGFNRLELAAPAVIRESETLVQEGRYEFYLRAKEKYDE